MAGFAISSVNAGNGSEEDEDDEVEASIGMGQEEEEVVDDCAPRPIQASLLTGASRVGHPFNIS